MISSLPAWSWQGSTPRPLPQAQTNDNDFGDDEWVDDTSVGGETMAQDAGASAASDGGPKDAGPTEARPKEQPTRPPVPAAPPAATPDAGAPIPPPGTPPGTPPVRTAPTAPPTLPPPTAPPSAPTQPGKALVGGYQVDATYEQGALVWEMRILWIAGGLLALSFVLLFLHFLIPIGGLRFLSQGSHALLVASTLGLGGVLLYRVFGLGHWPGGTMQSSLLWFALTASVAYLWQRRRYKNVYIGSGALLLVMIAAIAWVLNGNVVTPGFVVSATKQSQLWLLANEATYTAFGLLAAAGSWMVASVFLGMLARRNRGLGYGLEPSQWEEYRLHPSFFAFLAYPLLTVAWVLQLLWSQQYLGDAMLVWSNHPRLWTVPFCWLLLTAHLFALRFPRPKASPDEFDEVDELDTPVSTQPAHTPGFLLFLATAGGSALFVGVHFLLTYLRSS